MTKIDPRATWTGSRRELAALVNRLVAEGMRPARETMDRRLASFAAELRDTLDATPSVTDELVAALGPGIGEQLDAAKPEGAPS